MAGVRVTNNRIVTIEEGGSTDANQLRVTAVRYVVLRSVTNNNPDFPTGLQTVTMVTS